MIQRTNNDQTLWRGKPSSLLWFRSILFVLFLVLSGGLILLIEHIPLPEKEYILGFVKPELQQYVVLGFLGLAAILSFGIYLSRIRRGRYRVTARRVVERHGLISYRTNEVRIRDIRGVNVRQSVWERIFGIGTLEIASAATGTKDVSFFGIRHPVKVKNLIHRIQAQEG